jgi:hypothetical protein
MYLAFHMPVNSLTTGPKRSMKTEDEDSWIDLDTTAKPQPAFYEIVIGGFRSLL